jgi:hypothetical protein
MSTSPHSLPTPGTQPSKDINKLPIYSDSTYPVGPSVSGEISYIHFPPLSPLSSPSHFLFHSAWKIAPDAPAPNSNNHNYSQPFHRPLPLVLHLPYDQETTRLPQHGTLQPSIHALALRPSPKDAASANDGRDPAVRAPRARAVGNAHRAPADGPRLLPRFVALPALAIAYTLVFAIVRVVAAYDAYAVLVVYGRGLGGHRRACECEYLGTCRRESYDAQEGRT